MAGNEGTAKCDRGASFVYDVFLLGCSYSFVYCLVHRHGKAPLSEIVFSNLVHSATILAQIKQKWGTRENSENQSFENKGKKKEKIPNVTSRKK